MCGGGGGERGKEREHVGGRGEERERERERCSKVGGLMAVQIFKQFICMPKDYQKEANANFDNITRLWFNFFHIIPAELVYIHSVSAEIHCRPTEWTGHCLHTNKILAVFRKSQLISKYL